MRAFPARQNSSLPLPWRMFLLATLVVLLLVVSADGITGQTTDDHGDRYTCHCYLSVTWVLHSRAH